MKFRKTLMGTCALALIACSSAPKKVDMAKVSPDKLDFETSKSFFEEHGEIDDALEKTNRVLVGNYRVGFMHKGLAFAKKEGSSSTDTAGMTWTVPDQQRHAKVMLHGITDKDMQEIVEEAYKDLHQRLKASGREIVDFESVKQFDGFKELKITDPDKNGNYITDVGFFGLGRSYSVKKPKHIPLWYGMGEILDGGGSFSTAGNALAMKNFGNMKNLAAKSDSVLIDLTYMIDIADIGARRNGDIWLKPQLTVQPTRVSFFTAKDSWIGVVPGPTGYLKRPNKQPFNHGNDYAQIKSGSDVKRSMASWEDSKVSINADIHADPAKFKKEILKSLKLVNATIANYAKEYK